MQAANSTNHGKIQLRGIIFDYGNVLCCPQQPADMEKMAAVCGIPAARVRELYWKSRLAYDHGDMDGHSYWTSLGREAGVPISQEQIARLCELDAASWARENVAVVRWVQQLHEAGYRLALLSNMPHELSRSLSAQGTWAKFFQHRVFSCDVRHNKPDPAIYKICLDALKLPANDVLFLDDISANVESARRLGIHSLVFDTLEGTWARMSEQFDLPAPLDLAQAEPV